MCKIIMRHDDLIASVNQFLTAPPYEACLLLVHPHPVDLHDAMLRLEAAFHWPGWPAGQELAAVLLDVAPQLRPSVAAGWFREACAARRPGPVLVSDIALLFERALSLDPLRLLRDASRQTQLIVAWPGTVDDNRLAYAVPEHAHCRYWPTADLCPGCIITL